MELTLSLATGLGTGPWLVRGLEAEIAGVAWGTDGGGGLGGQGRPRGKSRFRLVRDMRDLGKPTDVGAFS